MLLSIYITTIYIYIKNINIKLKILLISTIDTTCNTWNTWNKQMCTTYDYLYITKYKLMHCLECKQ